MRVLGFPVLIAFLSLHRAVSAGDINRNKKVPGLQDNVDLMFKHLMKQHSFLQKILLFRWANINHFLGVAIALAVSTLWKQVI